MFGLLRRFLLLILLTLSVAVPYLAMSERLGSARDQIAGFFSPAADEATSLGLDPETGEYPTVTGLPADQASGLAAGPTNLDLREILRFDLDPRWIMHHWPRVSSVSSISQGGRYDGLRVPLVTGTNMHDLAGSLTYYFDKHQQMQRLTFHGYTGDERNLVSMVTHHYRLKAEPAAGAGVFVAKWNAKPTSALWIRRLPVVHAGNVHQKFEVILELNRPNNYAGLSPEFENMLRHAKAHQPAGTGIW